MCKDILISLDPEHSENVFTGRKTVELRRRAVRVSPGTRVWIYTKRPRACIDGIAVVESVHEASQEELWSLFGDRIAISRSDFDQYLAGIEKGCAIVFGSISALPRTIALEEIRRRVHDFHPPQFFKRLGPNSRELAVLSSCTSIR